MPVIVLKTLDKLIVPSPRMSGQASPSAQWRLEGNKHSQWMEALPKRQTVFDLLIYPKGALCVSIPLSSQFTGLYQRPGGIALACQRLTETSFHWRQPGLNAPSACSAVPLKTYFVTWNMNSWTEALSPIESDYKRYALTPCNATFLHF